MQIEAIVRFTWMSLQYQRATHFEFGLHTVNMSWGAMFNLMEKIEYLSEISCGCLIVHLFWSLHDVSLL